MSNSIAALANETNIVTRSVCDTSAFAALYDHYFSRIYNYIRYRVQDTEVTDDLTAQVFERALVNIGRYNAEKAPFAAWLFTIARNTTNDYLRGERRRRWLSLDALSHRASNEPQPSEIVADDEVRDQLLLAVASLSSRERDLIGLKFAAGLTNRRIAEMTGLREGNVAIILYRAMRRLRAELEAQGVSR